MNKSRGWYLLFALAALPLLVLAPVTVDASASSKTIGAGKAMRAAATQGWVKLGPISADSISHDSTLFYFSGVSAAFPTLGFAAQSGANITALALSLNSVTYSVTQGIVAKQTYLYTTRGIPVSVEGGSYSYDVATQVLTVTTSTSGDVKVTFSSGSNPMGGAVILNSQMAMSVLCALAPILMGAVTILGVYSGSLDGRGVMMMVVLTLVAAVLGLIGFRIITLAGATI